MFIVELENGNQITEEDFTKDGKLWTDIDVPLKRVGIGTIDNIKWLEGATKYGQIKDRAVGVYQDIDVTSQYIFAEYLDGSTMTIRYSNGKHYEYRAIPFTLNKNIWRKGLGSSN
jgi:hypothetical protein